LADDTALRRHPFALKSAKADRLALAVVIRDIAVPSIIKFRAIVDARLRNTVVTFPEAGIRGESRRGSTRSYRVFPRKSSGRSHTREFRVTGSLETPKP